MKTNKYTIRLEKEEDVDEFDKGFPLKEKLKLQGQILGKEDCNGIH